VWDDAAAQQVNRVMGKRVTHDGREGWSADQLFGETRHFVTAVAAVDERQGPVVVPVRKGAARSAMPVRHRPPTPSPLSATHCLRRPRRQTCGAGTSPAK
jgi:hypothetical protein